MNAGFEWIVSVVVGSERLSAPLPSHAAPLTVDMSLLLRFGVVVLVLRADEFHCYLWHLSRRRYPYQGFRSKLAIGVDESRNTYIQVNIHINMVSKTITITQDAYHRLLRKKHTGESFSEVILRTVKFFTAQDLKRLLGTISRDTAEKIHRHIVTQRKRTQEDFDKREHDLFG